MIKTQCLVVRVNLNALRYSNEILTPVCISHLQNNGRMRLMHDGAPSHTARFTRALLQANRINVLPWPSLSPDLNPIIAHLGRNCPKGYEPCIAQHTGLREIRS